MASTQADLERQLNDLVAEVLALQTSPVGGEHGAKVKNTREIAIKLQRAADLAGQLDAMRSQGADDA